MPVPKLECLFFSLHFIQAASLIFSLCYPIPLVKIGVRLRSRGRIIVGGELVARPQGAGV